MIYNSEAFQQENISGDKNNKIEVLNRDISHDSITFSPISESHSIDSRF